MLSIRESRLKDRDLGILGVLVQKRLHPRCSSKLKIFEERFFPRLNFINHLTEQVGYLWL